MKKQLTFFVLVTAALSYAGPLPWLSSASGQSVGEELFRVTASDGAPFRVFGASVGVSGSRAIVGSPGPGDDGLNSGTAYLFDVTTGQELAKIIASDAVAQDHFGSAVAISGNRAIVGAYANDAAGPVAGAAYLFDAATGQELLKLTASDASGDEWFGSSVAISGDTAIVGAVASDSFTGSAYLFNVTTGQERFKFTASDTGPSAFFGNSVAISGDIALVGAHSVDNGSTAFGAAYVYDVTTGQELLKLINPDPRATAFGHSVAISGNTAIVGSPLIGGASAYLFDATTGQQLAKLTAPDATDLFGIAVAIDGNTAIVGGGSYQEGFQRSAFLFNVATGEQLAKLTPSGTIEPQDINFGESVALSGDFAVVGFSQDNRYAGSAYVYSAVPEPASFVLLAFGVPLLACWMFRRRQPARCVVLALLIVLVLAAPGLAQHKILHSFNGDLGDGYNPLGSLLQSDSTLYGMTISGGVADYGTIFQIGTDGASYKRLHSFNTFFGDGYEPYYGSLIQSGSALYGMTLKGGTSAGTIFRIETDGTGFGLLHAFAVGDGLNPYGSLLLSGSTLYGMATSASAGSGGPGTVFQIGTDGTGFDVIHSFSGFDGGYPHGSLVQSGSTLYGMTTVGGEFGSGTVFSLVVPEPSSLALFALALPLVVWRNRRRSDRRPAVVAAARSGDRPQQ